MAHLYASFGDAVLAEKAAGALLDYGVRPEDISIVANDAFAQAPITQHADISEADPLNQVGDRMAGASEHAEGIVSGSDAHNLAVPYGSTVEAGMIDERDETPIYATDYETAAKHGISTTTPEDAGQGAVKGAEIGLGLGVLAGLAALFIPGVGLVYGAGALASALGAAALTAGAGAVAGGVTGYLKEQGVPGEAAQSYQSAIENGGAILNITLPSGVVDQATAEQVLVKYSAADMHSY
jgi:hypothetical protein